MKFNLSNCGRKVKAIFYVRWDRKLLPGRFWYVPASYSAGVLFKNVRNCQNFFLSFSR